MKKKILFVINPISGTGRQKFVEKAVEQLLDKEQFEYSYAYTKKAKDAIRIGKKNANKVNIIVAVGGDGSVNEVSQGIIGSKTSLAVIPTGSGNGFARYFKIPRNIEKAIEIINKGKIKLIDTIKINNSNYVNVAGVGFDAKISHNFATYGKRGFWPYFRLITEEAFTHRAEQYRIFIDGIDYTDKYYLVSFANSSQFGFEAHIAPNSKIDDGLIDVCLVKKFPVWATPTLAVRLFNKTIDKSLYTETVKAKEIVVKNENHRIKAHIDGEPVYFPKELKIRINPLSLKVIIP